jgi:hypothetical protein
MAIALLLEFFHAMTETDDTVRHKPPFTMHMASRHSVG